MLFLAFAIGAVAGVASGGGQGTPATAQLLGGLIKSAHAQNIPAAMPGDSLLAGKAYVSALQWRVVSVRGQAEVRKGGRLWHQWSSARAGVPLEPRAQLRTGRRR